MTMIKERFSRRGFLAGSAGGLVLAGSMMRGRKAWAADPVKVGFTMPLTGYLAVAAPIAYQAYELWADRVNAAGGLDIGGKEKRPVELVRYDDQSEPTKTAQTYEKMITEDNVDLLLAPYATPFHIALAPVAERHKFPIVGAAAASTLLRDLGVKYMWFAETMTDSIGRQVAKFLIEQKFKSIAVLTLQLPFSLEIKKAMVEALEAAGANISINVEYPPDIRDMTGMLTSVKAAQPDAIIGLSYPEDSILYTTTARELGINAPMQLLLIAPSAPYYPAKFPGADSEGITTIGHWSPTQTKWPRAKPFHDAYLAKFKEEPDYLDTVVTYMSAEILEQAVAKAGLDREGIRESIANDTFETINGPVKFNGVENTTTPPGLLQIQNGHLEVIYPPEIATSSFKPKTGWSK